MKVKFIDYSKNILVYKQRRDFLYQCLEENFKDAIRFKKPTVVNMVTVGW
jgi:hypothetical protein